MKRIRGAFIGVAVLAASIAVAAPAAHKEAKGKKVDYEVYKSYFESNKSGLKGAQSFLAFSTPDAFNKVFGKAVVMGKKRKFLTEDDFDSKVVVAAIKRGGDIWTYKVEKVTATGSILNVYYKAMSRDGGGARFASPLIIAVPKGKYTHVVFYENGKKVGAAK